MFPLLKPVPHDGQSDPGKQLIQDSEVLQKQNRDENVAFIVLGASGDLATKKIYPNLWKLYRDNRLPSSTHVIGFALEDFTVEQIRDRFEKYVQMDANAVGKFQEFLAINSYVRGSCEEQVSFEKLDESIEDACKGGRQPVNRIFYLALPPQFYIETVENIHEFCMAKKGAWTRVVVEKPFGHDLSTSNKLARHLSFLFQKEEIYRIDHYLGKEMVQNMLVLRFANALFGSIWNNNNIAAVMITFKEPFGAMGRANYFDKAGIIRDVMQNHLMQVLCLAAMERPVSLEAKDINAEKLKVLRWIKDVELSNCVIGQYTADPNGTTEDAKTDYTKVSGVSEDSITPTFATAVLYVENDRWAGVPFILRCGKALNEHKTELRIQFKDAAGSSIFSSANFQIQRNELVLRVQENGMIYLKMTTKKPELETLKLEKTELDSILHEVKFPDAHERLLFEVFAGNQQNFVQHDEDKEAWRIFTPLLQKLQRERIKPIKYQHGTRGPKESDDLCARVGYKRYIQPDRKKDL